MKTAHEQVGLFLLQAAAIIMASQVLSKGAKWIGQPVVIAETITGVLLGPSFLGWLSPHLESLLFDAKSLTLLSAVSEIGLILFMFLVGAEVDFELLRKRMRSALVIGSASIMLPFTLGCVLARFLYTPQFSPARNSLSSFSLFMGVSMGITAFPVLARMLAERKLLSCRLGTLALGVALLDDVVAWTLLACVVALTKSSSMAVAARIMGYACVFVAAMFFVVRPALQWLTARLHWMSERLWLAFMISLLLCASWLTQAIGIHSLFGAFLLGLICPRSLVQRYVQCIEEFVLVFFLPLFFAQSGLRTRINLLGNEGIWGVTLVVIALACAGKIAGGTLASRALGASWRESLALGALLNARGLVELIALNLALDLGLITTTLFTVMVIMALTTTVVTSPLLSRVYPTIDGAADEVQLSPAFEPRENAA